MTIERNNHGIRIYYWSITLQRHANGKYLKVIIRIFFLDTIINGGYEHMLKKPIHEVRPLKQVVEIFFGAKKLKLIDGKKLKSILKVNQKLFEHYLVDENIDYFDFQPPVTIPTMGIMIKDWKRSCGVNVIIQAEELLRKSPIPLKGVIIISNQFSSAAENLAKRINIRLLTRGYIGSYYNEHPELRKLLQEASPIESAAEEWYTDAALQHYSML